MMKKKGGFQFQQFFVRHDRCAMKVGTDGVLLGAWASGGRRILDIGTGTGLIAMMMAQRFPDAAVDAVDVDAAAVGQALENVATSPFADRIRVSLSPVQQFVSPCYDAIVSNPPYFQNSLKNPDAQRTAARHTDTLPYRELFAAAGRLLTADGEFSAIMPFDCKESFEEEALLSGFVVSRECAVRTTPSKPPRRYLMAFRKALTGAREAEIQMLSNADNTRSEWYRQLTKDFYL